MVSIPPGIRLILCAHQLTTREPGTATVNVPSDPWWRSYLGSDPARVNEMRIDIIPGRGRISVGPPGGPTETIPASVTVTITDTLPYEVEARLEWSPTVGKLAIRKICCTALPGGDDVSPLGIARIALRDTVQAALEAEYLGGTGWPGLVDKHRNYDPLAVDALIYLLAVAFQSSKPTVTVALARGLSPASGPKRVLAARRAGLLPETEPGKSAGA